MKIQSSKEAIKNIKSISVVFIVIGILQTIYWLVFQNLTFRVEGIILLSLALLLLQKKSIIASIGLLVFSVFVIIVINKNISNIILSLLMVYLSIIALRATIYMRKELKHKESIPKKNNTKNLTNRLIKQRNMWLDSVINYLSNSQLDENIDNLDIKSAMPIVTAFQIVHNLSFINMQKYIEEKDMDIFVTKFIDSISAEFKADEWSPYLSNYEANKKKDIGDQLAIFCEDVSMAILGSYSGMLYGSAFVSLAQDFLIRNQAIIADTFGDQETLKKSADFIKKRFEEAVIEN